MTTDQTPPAVWIDGDPLMEAIAAAVWEQCSRDDEDMPQLVLDDPRNIAAAAAAAVSSVGQAPATDRAAKAEALLLRFTAEAHRRKWSYDRGVDDDGVPIKSEAFEALHRLGEEMRVELEKLRAVPVPVLPAPTNEAAVPGRTTDETRGECAASVSGRCLAEAQSEAACATEDGECVHGGRPAVGGAQEPTEADCPAALLPFGTAPAEPCVVKGKHREHATAEGRRWTNEEV